MTISISSTLIPCDTIGNNDSEACTILPKIQLPFSTAFIYFYVPSSIDLQLKTAIDYVWESGEKHQWKKVAWDQS